MSGIPFWVRVRIPVVVGALVLLQFVPGCGEGKFPVRPAKGKVVCGGKSVTGGSVTFMPIAAEGSGAEAGKPATATVGSDGTFVLTTHERFDGAIVGKHRVQYTGPEDEQKEEDETAPSSEEEPAAKPKRARAQDKSQCVQKGEITVEVKADGENDFTIELFPPGK